MENAFEAKISIILTPKKKVQYQLKSGYFS